MTTAAVTAVERELAAVVGAEYVREAPEFGGVRAAAEVAPANEAELAAVLRLCHERGWSVTPTGGSTELHWGRTAPVDVLLRTRRLAGVERYDPGDLTVAVGAGSTCAELAAPLQEHQQFVPLEGADDSTVGGVLARAAHGPLSSGFGMARDFCIGVRFVTADGTVVKGGGRVVKNVAGYDLMKLLIGSHGSLGVITSVNFKVSPWPRQTLTLTREFEAADEAVRFAAVVRQSALTPMALELCSPEAWPLREAAAWRVVVRAGGSDRVLARFRNELGGAALRECSGEEERALWHSYGEFARDLHRRFANAMRMELALPLASVGAALQAAARFASEQGMVCGVVGRVPLGLFTLGFVPVLAEPANVMQYAQVVTGLRSALPEGGSAVVARCPEDVKQHVDVWGPAGSDVACMQAVKQMMDPAGTLNRGRWML